jgi:hypothetical protein
MSCCGACGGQDTDQIDNEDKNKEVDNKEQEANQAQKQEQK